MESLNTIPQTDLGETPALKGPSFSAISQPAARLARSGDLPRAREILPPRLLELLAILHHELEPERQHLLTERERRQARYDRGEVPTWIDDHPSHQGHWRVAEIPEDLRERRVEITGPANSAKMVIQMLNGTPEARADLAMLDLEDSMKPTWSNVVDSIHNIVGAAKCDLSYKQPAEGSEPARLYVLRNCDVARVMVRVRGLHLMESHVEVEGEPMSAAIFDLATCAFQTADLFLRSHKTPKYYVPKCEHYLEARWWNRLFSRVEEFLELPPGTLRVTFLIETLPAAFQMKEILYESRGRACGLNGGRWDKIFSDIKVLRMHNDRVLADRSSIDMKSPWMDRYARLLIKTCHEHGAFAMGGMAAFTPGKTPEVRQAQAAKVQADKAREASIGHDGCWVSHPFFIAPARREFKRENQLDVIPKDFPDRPELLPSPDGPKTLQGLRTNARVGIGYLNGWLNHDLGCVALDNLMEDLATLEISRAQTWQWLHHGVQLDDGTRVTQSLVAQVFEEELAKILAEVGDATQRENYERASQRAHYLFTTPELANFLSEAIAE